VVVKSAVRGFPVTSSSMRTPPRVMPAIVSPFSAEGDLDLDAHAHNVSRLAEAGIAGFVIGGSTGEGPYLEEGERSALVRATRQVAPDGFVLVGIVAEALRAGLRLAEECAGSGADAVLATTPTTLVRHRPDLVAGFYESLADASTLPVFLYSVPRVTAYDLPLDVAIALAEHPNVAGIKDSSGDLDRARLLARARFTVYVGASAIAGEAVAGGAYGAITASTNYAASLVRAVVEPAGGGDGRPNDRLRSLAAAVERHGVPGVKYAATRSGLRAGAPRLPLQPPSPEARAEIDAALESAGVV
jgi:4-hydroxy-2-oxoglutarate aldolase